MSMVKIREGGNERTGTLQEALRLGLEYGPGKACFHLSKGELNALSHGIRFAPTDKRAKKGMTCSSCGKHRLLKDILCKRCR